MGWWRQAESGVVAPAEPRARRVLVLNARAKLQQVCLQCICLLDPDPPSLCVEGTAHAALRKGQGGQLQAHGARGVGNLKDLRGGGYDEDGNLP